MIQQEPPTSTPIPLWAIFVAAGVPAVFVVLLLIAVIVLVIKLRRTQRANAERQHMLTDQENEYWSNTEYYQMETDRVPNASNRIRTVRYSGTPIDDDLSPYNTLPKPLMIQRIKQSTRKRKTTTKKC
jgi:hypothetical protein